MNETPNPNPNPNFEIDWASVPKGFWDLVAKDDKLPQEILHVSDETLLEYYSVAAGLLEKQNWSDAEAAFEFLVFLNPIYSDFWLGLGIAKHSLNDLKEASSAYEMAAQLEPSNPSIHLNAMKCFMELGVNALAEESYQKCLEACRDLPENKKFKEKAKELHESIFHRVH